MERKVLLASLYSGSAILSATSLICVAIAWRYWARTLGICIDINCGCILHGVNAFSTFMGGDVKICHFGAFGLLPATVVGLILGLYHGYRSCVYRSLNEPSTAVRLTTRDNRRYSRGQQIIVVKPKVRAPCKQWTPAALFAALLGCLSLAHAVVITDGYYKSCDQYRRQMIQLLGSSGREIQVIRDRLPCGAIFDFMDYLQPDSHDWRRGEEINTGLTLQFGLISTWLNFFSWIAACLVNFTMARKRLNSFGENSCCSRC